MSERKQTHLGVEVGSLGDEGGEGRVELRRETTARVAPRSVELEQEPAASTKGREMGCSQRRQELLFGLGGSSGLGCRGDGCWRMWRV